MNDPYPINLTIEIDRPLLKRYLCARYLLTWSFLSFFGGLFGACNIETHLRGVTSRTELVVLALECVAVGIGISLLVALAGYLAFSHRLASRTAASLEVSVEGAFLRVRQHAAIFSDRKLHFRAIVDYATTQDMLMRRFGLYALQMTTPAGGTNSTLVIHGIKDCLKVRDLLSEIDRLRENQ